MGVKRFIEEITPFLLSIIVLFSFSSENIFTICATIFVTTLIVCCLLKKRERYLEKNELSYVKLLSALTAIIISLFLIAYFANIYLKNALIANIALALNCIFLVFYLLYLLLSVFRMMTIDVMYRE